MIWRKAEPPAPEAPPLQDLPAGGHADAVRAHRGEAIALIGLADSGKTSFLFALRHAPERPNGLRWLWPASSLELARMTVHPGALLPATDPGVFKVSRLHTLHRKWRRPPAPPSHWLPPFLRPGRRIVIPEVSGEHVKDFARGAEVESLSDARQGVFRRFGSFLSECDEVLFLAGLRSSYHAGVLRQDDVESAMSEAAAGLDTIAGHVRATRRGDPHSPIFLTFLVTKRDSVKDVPGLDGVRLPLGCSAVARTASALPADVAGRIFRIDEDGYVTFSLNRASDEAGSNLELQEAIAVDFLACHAPKATAVLAGIAQRPGMSLRVLTGKPFGYECRTADNKSAAPSPGRLHSSMVWESLDDLVERSFRWRTRRRLGRAGAVAASLLLGVTLLGPLAARACRAEADRAIEAKDIAAARSWLHWDDLNPWSQLERRVSPAHERDDALRWRRLGDAAGPMGSQDLNRELAAETHRRDPFGDLAGQRLLQFHVDALVRYVELDPSLSDGSAGQQDLLRALSGAGHLRIWADDAATLARAAMDLRGKGPFPSIRSTGDWKAVAARLRKVAGWIGPGGTRGAEALVPVDLDEASIEAFRSELERSARAADLRAGIDEALAAVGGKFPWENARRLARDAAAADDRPSLERIDEMAGRAVDDEWQGRIGASEPGGPVVPDVAAALRDGVLPWPAAESLRRECAVRTLHERLAELANTVAAGRGVDSKMLGEAVERIPAANDALGGTAAGPPGQFRALMGMLDAARSRAELLDGVARGEGMRGDMVGRVGRAFGGDAEKDAQSPIELMTAGSDSPLRFSFRALFLQSSQAMCSGLQARLPSLADDMLARKGSREDIEAVARALDSIQADGNPCGAPSWIAALVGGWRVARGEEPDAGPRVAAFAKEDFLRPRLPRLMESIAKSGNLPRIGPQALVAVQQVNPLMPEERKLAAGALVGAVPAESWMLGDAPGWQEALLHAAAGCGFDSAGMAAAEGRKALAAALGSSKGPMAVKVWHRVAAALAPSRDLTPDIYDAALRALAKELERAPLGSSKGAVESLLEDVFKDVGAGNDSARKLGELLGDVERHRSLVDKLGLVAVIGPGGSVDHYLGAEEYPKLRKVTQDDAIKAAADLGLGVRLPTVAEWRNVRRKGLAQGSPEYDAVRSRYNAATGNAQDPAVERQAGDIISLPGGREAVGMAFGVREWCSDAKDPQGESWEDLSDGVRASYDLHDVGVRLALDPLPASLVGYVAQAPAILPAGGRP